MLYLLFTVWNWVPLLNRILQGKESLPLCQYLEDGIFKPAVLFVLPRCI